MRDSAVRDQLAELEARLVLGQASAQVAHRGLGRKRLGTGKWLDWLCCPFPVAAHDWTHSMNSRRASASGNARARTSSRLAFQRNSRSVPSVWKSTGSLQSCEISIPSCRVDVACRVQESNPEAAFKNAIFRVEADPQERKPQGMAQVPVTTGEISVPLITLHNLGDLVGDPQPDRLAECVAAQGNSDLLVQRDIRGVGHCDFTANEAVNAFLELVAWERFGIKPSGDDFSDPDFGCAYTDDPGNEQVLAMPCP